MILSGLQLFEITVIASVITAISIGLQLSEITSIASVIVTICAGLQLLETTLQGEKLSAGIGEVCPEYKQRSMRCAKRSDQAPKASALCKVHRPSIVNLRPPPLCKSEQAKIKEFQNGTRNRNQQRSS